MMASNRIHSSMTTLTSGLQDRRAKTVSKRSIKPSA